MEKFLSDQSKFQKTTVKNDDFLNFITSKQKRIHETYKKLVNSNSIFVETRRHLKPVWTMPGIMYVPFKVHKKCVDVFPPFKPILSALQTPTYNLVKFLLPILEPLTTNKYTVKGSFNFATEIVEQDSKTS